MSSTIEMALKVIIGHTGSEFTILQLEWLKLVLQREVFVSDTLITSTSVNAIVVKFANK